jgi:outer membrane biosynthesis protein TonB
MMRKVIAATIALSPLMLHAQANMPAQPQAIKNVPVLQSKLGQPQQLFAAVGADTGTTKAGMLRVSTGVTTPKLIHSVDVVADPATNLCLMSNNCKFVVGMTVDKTGKPSNLKIVQSGGIDLDQNVLTSVSQYRFTPGLVSNQPVETPVFLNVIIVNPRR